MADAAAPLGPSGGTAPRQQVVLGGRRVKTVDIHAHCAVPAAMALMGMTVAPEILRIGPERLPQMDAQGIDVEALSINPYWYTAERDLARQIITIQNEKLAEFCAAQPERFVAFATVALQYPDLAAEQLEDGIKRLGLRGVSVGGSVNGEELSDPKFHPFWAKAEALGVLVFLHPQGVPDLEKRLQGNGLLTNVIGNPLETPIALSHLRTYSERRCRLRGVVGLHPH
jgi:aminocarboxymuconate-semialdehyde decarboxylase